VLGTNGRDASRTRRVHDERYSGLSGEVLSAVVRSLALTALLRPWTRLTAPKRRLTVMFGRCLSGFADPLLRRFTSASRASRPPTAYAGPLQWRGGRLQTCGVFSAPWQPESPGSGHLFAADPACLSRATFRPQRASPASKTTPHNATSARRPRFWPRSRHQRAGCRVAPAAPRAPWLRDLVKGAGAAAENEARTGPHGCPGRRRR